MILCKALNTMYYFFDNFLSNNTLTRIIIPAATKIICTKADALKPKKIMPQITMSNPAMMYNEFFMTILLIR